MMVLKVNRARRFHNYEEEGGEDVPDGSQDGGECLSDSDSLDANKIFKDWHQLKQGHKLER